MVMNFRQIATAGLALSLALPNMAIGQDINLASGAAQIALPAWAFDDVAI